MTYNATNTVKARVYDVDTQEEIVHVMEVNTQDNTLKIFDGITLDNQLMTVTMKFRSIYPIYGELAFPQLFHCYGRLNED